MSLNVKNKSIRANRKALWMKPESYFSSNLNNGWMVPYIYNDVKGPISDSSPNVESSSWVLCNGVQLEDISLKCMEIIYNDTVSKLVTLGHNEDIALKAILHNVHCYGVNDLATDLLHNTLTCLKNVSLDMYEFKPAFSDLKKLEEYTLMNLVSLLREVRLELGKRDAMWCLLMSDYNVLKAITIHIPIGSMCSPLTGLENQEWGFRKDGDSGIPLKGFFCGKEMKLQRDIEFLKRFDLSPAMIYSLKRNVAVLADGYRTNSKQVQSQEGEFPGISTTSKLDSSPVSLTALLAELGELPADPNDMNYQDVPKDARDKVIVTLCYQIKDLEKQVKERKDWAHDKAIQAARKLSSYLIELKTSRIEREENQRLEKVKETNEELEDPTMVRLLEMEEALRKACGQMDLATAGVEKLEAEKAEIKAELEACKLSASESVASTLQVAKREKKCLKKLLVSEKQKAKIERDISDEKQKIWGIQEELTQIKQCAKEAEVMRGEELKAKEEALVLIEEERRSKEAAEANQKRNLKALSLKIELDFQRRRDDLLRVEQEISCLKASAQSATLPLSDSEDAEPQREIIAKLLQELDNVPEFAGKEAISNTDRECIICGKDEVSVIFLPCAHQVMCASCSKEYGRNGKAVCPCCRVPIEQRIRIFGASP